MTLPALAQQEQRRPSLIAKMAQKFNMDPDQFAATVRATVMPEKHTNEQFAALMMVAHEYGLNPVVKEIYAFPAKGGGIVPIVSIDGWLNLINSHPQFDGFDVDFQDNDKGDPVSCTVSMYRKDRGRPVVVTEYFAECVRSTDPWKMKHRMLRHKAVIQCARYAFGFSGIYEEDEAAAMKDITPSAPPPPPPPAPALKVLEHPEQAPASQNEQAAKSAAPEAADTAAPPPPPNPGAAGAEDTKAPPPPLPGPANPDDVPAEAGAFIKMMEARMKEAQSEDDVVAVWHDMSPEDVLDFPPDLEEAQGIYDRERGRFGNAR